MTTTGARFACPWPVGDADSDGPYTIDCGAAVAVEPGRWSCRDGHYDTDAEYAPGGDPAERFAERVVDAIDAGHWAYRAYTLVRIH